MAEAYRVSNRFEVHFVTCTVTHWIDVFSRPIYAQIIVDSLRYCQIKKGLSIHAWCMMTNHIHLIASSDELPLGDILRDFKKFTAYKIYREIKDSTLSESRREWMLKAFQAKGMENPDNVGFQFWQPGYHPVELNNRLMAEQHLNYLHDNPVRAGFVRQAWDYRYSSAIDYMLNKPGLIPVQFL